MSLDPHFQPVADHINFQGDDVPFSEDTEWFKASELSSMDKTQSTVILELVEAEMKARGERGRTPSIIRTEILSATRLYLKNGENHPVIEKVMNSIESQLTQ